MGQLNHVPRRLLGGEVVEALGLDCSQKPLANADPQIRDVPVVHFWEHRSPTQLVLYPDILGNTSPPQRLGSSSRYQRKHAISKSLNPAHAVRESCGEQYLTRFTRLEVGVLVDIRKEVARFHGAARLLSPPLLAILPTQHDT